MSQVGFTFQGDVFTGGSLVMNTTGRLLKALSDGNVDVLAVAASLELGKSIPITRIQEAIVARSMQKRSITRSGILAKALSVGWGHSDVAYELSKTRAGCATLLLLNALASGISTFKAAEGLQELLVYHGCSPDVLPTVDSLNTVVRYVTPIMIDSGFHAIMENTHIAITVEMKKTFSLQDFHKWQPEIMQDSVDMKDWVDSVRQLCYSASRKESLQVRINGRVAWLATFAVQILGMGCAVICGATVLWETAGNNGKLFVYFGPSETLSYTTSLASALGFSLEPRDDMGALQTIRGRYLLKDAIRSEIEKSAEVTSSFYPTFCICFVRYFASMFGSKAPIMTYSIVSEYQRPKAIKRILGYLGVDFNTQIETAMLETLSTVDIEGVKRDIRRSLDDLGGGTDFAKRLCGTVVILAIALGSCHISVDNLSVPTLKVDKHLSQLDCAEGVMPMSPDSKMAKTQSLTWTSLCDLFFSERYVDRENTARSVAKSADGITLSIRMLFEDEAFTRDGQIYSIYPGQMAYRGIRRQDAVLAPAPSVLRSPTSPECDNWALAPGITFKHPHAPLPGVVDIKMSVEVRDALEITTFVMLGSENARRTYIFHSLMALRVLAVYGTLANSCSHPSKNSFSVPFPDAINREFSNRPSSFSAATLAAKLESECTFLSPPGRSRLHQLLSILITYNLAPSRTRFVVQEDACLSCSVKQGCELPKNYMAPSLKLVIICNPAMSNTAHTTITIS